LTVGLLEFRPTSRSGPQTPQTANTEAIRRSHRIPAAPPLDTGPYAFVWVDAITVNVREDGRVVNVHALIPAGMKADGDREILGLDASAEDGAGWLAFLRGLVVRGMSAVQLVTSDGHPGLVAAIGSALPGPAWQR
jgi:transposase-like protein